jgi:hypothetical protein
MFLNIGYFFFLFFLLLIFDLSKKLKEVLLSLRVICVLYIYRLMIENLRGDTICAIFNQHNDGFQIFVFCYCERRVTICILNMRVRAGF